MTYRAFESEEEKGLKKKEFGGKRGELRKNPNRKVDNRRRRQSNNPIGAKFRSFRRKLRNIFGGRSVSEGSSNPVENSFSSIFRPGKKKRRRR